MKKNIVTVVIPVFNAEKTVLKCLTSVQKQKHKWLDVIIIDDCSTDQSNFIIKDFVTSDNRFRLLKQSTNQGASSARNYGIQQARGSLLYFIDADDWITSKAIHNLVNCYQNNMVNLVCGGHTQYRGNNFLFTKNCGLESNTLFSTKEFIFYVKKYLRLPYQYLLPVHCWNKLYNLKIIQTYHIQFDTSLSQLEDVHFNFRYLKYVDTLMFNCSFDYFHRIDKLNNSYSSKAGTEHNAITKCVKAFSPIKEYLIKKDIDHEIDQVTELGHHFITTAVIYILRATRRFINNPSFNEISRIRQWVSSSLFKANIQYYIRQPKESRIFHAVLKTRSTILIFVVAVYRLIIK